jgi:methionyl-tRNA formyltransferase
MNEETETGVSLHLMDESLDTGPVLLQRKIKIKQGFNGDTGGTLKDKSCIVARTAIKDLLTTMNNDFIIPINQKEQDSSYFPQISEKDILIDFDKPSTKIDALVRGLSPWQPTYVSVNNKFLKVGKIKFMENKTKFHSDKYKSGLILKKNKKHLWVLTGDDKIAKLSNLKLLGIDGLFFTPFFLNHFVKAGDFCKR